MNLELSNLSGCRAIGFFTAIISLFACLSVNAINPPVVEDFESGVPGDSYWSFNSTGDGRIQTVLEEYTHLVQEAGVTPSSLTAADYIRGNFYQCDRSGTLQRQGIYLERSIAQWIYFGVYESDTLNGTYSRVSYSYTWAPIGSNTVYSSNVNIPMTAGKYYAIGAGWRENARYQWQGDHAPPIEVSFGQTTYGLYSNTTGIPPATIGSANQTGACYRQELDVDFDDVLRMDDSVNLGFSTNSATLTVNLLNYDTATLSFSHRESGDEYHVGDAVQLSTDGINYYNIYNLDSSSYDWADVSIDLVQAASNVGLTLGAATRIRFQQVDDYPWPSDGREFDDIMVYSDPDLLADGINSAGNTTPIFTWKGFSSTKTIPITQPVQKLGGISALPSTLVRMNYKVVDYLSQEEVHDGSYGFYMSIPALSQSTVNYSGTQNVPGATVFSNLIYLVNSTVDSLDAVTEGCESNNTDSLAFFVNHYSGSLWFDDIETDITITNWSSASFFSSTHHRISGTGTLNGFSFNFLDLEVLKDQTTLDYTIHPSETATIWVNTPGIDDVANVRFDRPGGVTLSRNGASGSTRAWLPSGLGIDTSPTYVMQATMTFSSSKLKQALYPASTVTRSGPFYISEETKPLHYYVDDIAWNPAQGTFRFNENGVSFVRGNDLDFLESHKTDLIDPDMIIKRSNAQHYRSVVAVRTPIDVKAGSNRDARVSTIITLDPGEFRPHFPYGPDYMWQSPSDMAITDDLVDASYELKDPKEVKVSYAVSAEVAECASTDPATVVTGYPIAHALFNKDGGIRQEVAFSNIDLRWGKHVNGNYAQTARDFDRGTYYMPGHFIRGDQSNLALTDNYGPAVIMLSGTVPDGSNKGNMERPGHYSGAENYRNGFADYAGINLRCVNDYDHGGRCTLGGKETDSWPLTGRSKYYFRPSGVSGIQEAVFGEFPDSLVIYGYIHDFSNFGLSYLSNMQKESRINGLVQIPTPSNFDVEYEELTLDPVGELLSADVGSAPDKTMEYWDAVIDPAALFYAPTAKTDCSNNERVLCMGVTSHCANIENMLAGILGFLPNGQIAAPEDEVEGVDSRLSVGNLVELDGPSDEIYHFTPMVNPYYNDESIGGGDRGWINFAGTVDVAFFDDLQVLFHTSASTNSTTAPIYMMGGFTDDNGYNFIDDPNEFDDRNAGWPHQALASVDDYRNPSSDAYRVRAQRNWLNVINFDYPLQWSTATKSFKSPEAEKSDLLVLEVEHQTDYLSAENAEISFGIQYDGLPQINIANMAFNAIDEATGMAQAFVDGVGDALVKTVEGGLDEFDSMLADVPEQLFDPLLDATLDPVVDTLYTALQNAYSSNPAGNYYSTALNNFLLGGGGVPNTILDGFDDLLAAGGSATNLLDDVNDGLEMVIRTIDAFTGTVTIDPVSGTNLAQAIDGLLNLEGTQFDVLGDLASSILGSMAANLVNQLAGELEPKINEFLGQVRPALESAGEYLNQVKDVVEQAQEVLGTGLSFAEELQDALSSNPLNSALGGAYTNLVDRFDDLVAAGDLFTEYTAAEIKQMIRQEIDDAFYGSLACCNIQQVLRSRLYDVDASLREAIDSVFQQLNKAIRDLVSEFTSGIDDEINGMLGDLSDTIGAGQIDGYAHIKGDTLTELRLDGKFQWEVPDEMEFSAYMIYRQLDSDGSGSCSLAGGQAAEVVLGSEDIDLSWTGTDIRAAIMTKFSFQTSPFAVLGLAGSFEMIEGEIGFESFTINELYAAVAFGAFENYLSAALKCQMSSFEVSGGVFFGRTCTLDPFAWDPDVQGILGDPPFTGIYVYGEGWMPIVSYGCLFQIKAGAGAGIFAFLEGPVGGKVFLGAEGEALCVVTIRGEVTLVGMKNGDILRMKGKGKISGKLGACPFCVKFKKSVEVTYENGSWDADY